MSDSHCYIPYFPDRTRCQQPDTFYAVTYDKYNIFYTVRQFLFLISPEYVPGIYFSFHIAKLCIVPVCDHGVA